MHGTSNRRHWSAGCGSTRGMTLIEVLAVIGIFGVLMTIGTVSTIKMSTLITRQKHFTETDSQVRKALIRISEDLRSTTREPGASFAAEQGSYSINGRTLPSDGLRFLCNTPSAESEDVTWQVDYSIGRSVSADEKGLIQRLRVPGEKGGMEQNLCPAVVGLDAKFLPSRDATAFVGDWARGIPAAVKLVLIVENVRLPGHFLTYVTTVNIASG